MCQHLDDSVSQWTFSKWSVNGISKRSIQVQDRQMDFNEKEKFIGMVLESTLQLTFNKLLFDYVKKIPIIL